jgi:hypothetical protein
MKTSIFWLVLFFIFLTAKYLHLIGDSSEWLKDVYLNVGTEILGIILTFFLIDNGIQVRELNEKKRIVKIVFNQLRIPLRKHLSMLIGMYRASLENIPNKPPLTLKELFGKNYVVELAYLDFSKLAPLIVNGQRITWFEYFHIQIDEFNSALSNTITKYAPFLDSDTIELIESLNNSSLLKFLSQSRVIFLGDKANNYIRDYDLLSDKNCEDLINQHTALVQELTTLINQNSPNDKQITLSLNDWRTDVAPIFGSARTDV